MVATSLETSTYEEIINIWKQIPPNYPESNLENQLVTPLLNSLGLNLTQIKLNPSLGRGTGLIPDYLVYTDVDKPPKLVIEDKKRRSDLATISNEEFIQRCKQHTLYIQAVGYPIQTGNNGIKQYLDKSNNNRRRYL
jgi:hypothetical protein